MPEKWTPKPSLPPPNLSVGVGGWLYNNLFSSPGNTALTFVGVFIIAWTLPPFFRWAFWDACWIGDARNACDAAAAGGASGACWVFIKVRLGLFMYGFYPDPERWRINLVFFVLAVQLLLLLVPVFSSSKRRQIFLCSGATMVTWLAWQNWPALFVFFYLFLPFGLLRAGNNPFLNFHLPNISLSGWRIIFIFTIYPVFAYFLLVGGVRGLPLIETHYWGGLFLTLVVAGTGMATALPIGVLLALGRRSDLPVIKIVCIGFIEFVRGVPLVSVLFMVSVMLPLFLPEELTINKLLRALIGVSFFYAAYMAEVIRGGLQALPQGQYEAARALGWGYWKMMGLIILPQVLRLVIPGLTNNFLSLIKDTTLVAVIGLLDLLGIAKAAMADSEWLGFTKESYVFAAVVFWVLCFGFSRYSFYLEKKYEIKYR